MFLKCSSFQMIYWAFKKEIDVSNNIKFLETPCIVIVIS